MRYIFEEVPFNALLKKKKKLLTALFDAAMLLQLYSVH